MRRVHIEKLVADWIQKIVEVTELVLVVVEYFKEPSGWVLRVFIDKPGGVDLEDWRQVSQALDLKLDEEDPIPGPTAWRYLLPAWSGP